MKYIILIVTWLLYTTPIFAQGEVVTPASNLWSKIIQGQATANITAVNPRYGYGNVGNMSLELKTFGSMNDWAFYTRDKRPGESWGYIIQFNIVVV